MHTKMKWVYFGAYEFPVPDLTFIFDAPVEVAQMRINRDSVRTTSEKFDKGNFQERVRENYLSFPRLLPAHNILIIKDNGKKSIEQIASEVQKIFKIHYSHLFSS